MSLEQEMARAAHYAVEHPWYALGFLFVAILALRFAWSSR